MAQDVNEKGAKRKLTARRQIDAELKDLKSNQSPNYQVTPNDNDKKEWIVDMYGPKDSPYVGGIFKIDIKFGKSYPAQPPKVKFTTGIYHMNISKAGQICIPSLIDEWDMVENMRQLLNETFELLKKPDPTAAIREDLLLLFVEQPKIYNENAINVTKEFAIKKQNNNNNNNNEKKKVEMKDDN